MPVFIEFSRCIGTYSSAKFEYIINSTEKDEFWKKQYPWKEEST